MIIVLRRRKASELESSAKTIMQVPLLLLGSLLILPKVLAVAVT